jgi:hypothetical protein
VKARPGDLVAVSWRDAVSITRGWESAEVYLRSSKVAPCRTVGYLLSRRGRAVVVALTVDLQQSHVLNGQSIPRGMVSSIRVLRRATKQERRGVR